MKANSDTPEPRVRILALVILGMLVLWLSGCGEGNERAGVGDSRRGSATGQPTVPECDNDPGIAVNSDEPSDEYPDNESYIVLEPSDGNRSATDLPGLPLVVSGNHCRALLAFGPGDVDPSYLVVDLGTGQAKALDIGRMVFNAGGLGDIPHFQFSPSGDLVAWQESVEDDEIGELLTVANWDGTGAVQSRPTGDLIGWSDESTIVLGYPGAFQTISLSKSNDPEQVAQLGSPDLSLFQSTADTPEAVPEATSLRDGVLVVSRGESVAIASMPPDQSATGLALTSESFDLSQLGALSEPESLEEIHFKQWFDDGDRFLVTIDHCTTGPDESCGIVTGGSESVCSIASSSCGPPVGTGCWVIPPSKVICEEEPLLVVSGIDKPVYSPQTVEYRQALSGWLPFPKSPITLSEATSDTSGETNPLDSTTTVTASVGQDRFEEYLITIATESDPTLADSTFEYLAGADAPYGPLTTPSGRTAWVMWMYSFETTEPMPGSAQGYEVVAITDSLAELCAEARAADIELSETDC